MATRHIAPQQARGEAIVGKDKQEKNVNAALGKNRRALGDIGNLVAVGVNNDKPQPQRTRPLTRGFCAQLLANAQGAANAENKNQACVKAVVKQKAPAAQKKQTVKPKPSEVIEISPDSEQPVKDQKKHTKKNETSKNKVTYTSVLTARSKAACGLKNKPKADIIDIDAADAGNDLAGVEYVDDIYQFYKSIEYESRPFCYMPIQTEINEKMRSVLVDWLIDVHLRFELSPETLYLTINIIDRFLSVKLVHRGELQLVGMSAMLMASKYEEIWPPEVNELVEIADHCYNHEQILMMEKVILGKLEWFLTLPTQFVFLARFIKASIPDEEMENMVYYLAELGLMDYGIITLHSPSKVAASAVYVARCTLKKVPVWTDTLKHHTSYSESQLMECAKVLVGLQTRAKEGKLQVVFRKYSDTERGAVALIPPFKTS